MKYGNLLAGIAFVLAVFIILSMPQEARYEEMKMDVKVADKIGINLDTDAIHFGGAVTGKGGGSSRNFTYTNREPTTRIITFELQGDMAKWVSISKMRLRLKANQSEELTASVNVPADASEGNYIGILRVTSRDAWLGII